MELKRGLGQTCKCAQKTDGGGSRGCAMHHQNLPPKPPSTHRTGSQSAASREGAEGLDPRRCPGRVLNSNPSPGTLAPFQVRRPGRSPTRLEAVHPVSQKEKPVGQAVVPLTPNTSVHLPRGCMQGREKSGKEKLELRGDCRVVKLGKWRDTHPDRFREAGNGQTHRFAVPPTVK